ncbi:hypothetical protein [Fulvivirga ligni]|uniref:hypothetical protein n=1 Tax=Fulvivirga ligni TaxID=2904246 RepID=UPI001F3B0C61|nr:hypothetical protein [Fulvivirga ligni]UII19854.1 hypothetical protein LVD16_18590 [Fulvivirga ligni]
MHIKIAFLVLSIIGLHNIDPTLNQNNKVLTSKKWTDQEDPSNNFIFDKNGQYKQNAEAVTFIGKWHNTGDNEIYLLLEEIQADSTSMFMNGFGTNTLGYYWQIEHIDDKVMKVKVRHENDTWDSGFVTEHTFVAEEIKL